MSSTHSSTNNSRRNSDESFQIVKRSVSPVVKENKAQNSMLLADSKNCNSKKERILYNIAIICREIFIIAVALFSVIIMTLFLHKLLHDVHEEYKNKHEKLKGIKERMNELNCSDIMPLIDGRCGNLTSEEMEKLNCSSMTSFLTTKCKDLSTKETKKLNCSENTSFRVIPFVIKECKTKLNEKIEAEKVSINVLNYAFGTIGDMVNSTVEQIGIYALFMMVIIFVLSTFLRISH